MSELKTSGKLSQGFMKEQYTKKIKQEAIKWVKSLRKYNQKFREAHFLEFMDIEENNVEQVI